MLTPERRSAFFPLASKAALTYGEVQYVDYGHYSKFSQMRPGFPLRGPKRENRARSILRMGNKMYFIRPDCNQHLFEECNRLNHLSGALLAICICYSYHFKGL